jgi:hypothetical protein
MLRLEAPATTTLTARLHTTLRHFDGVADGYLLVR